MPLHLQRSFITNKRQIWVALHVATHRNGKCIVQLIIAQKYSHSFQIPHNTPNVQSSFEKYCVNQDNHNEAKLAYANLWYCNCIQYDVMNNPCWETGQFITIERKRYKAPSPYELNESLLKNAIKNKNVLHEDQTKIL